MSPRMSALRKKNSTLFTKPLGLLHLENRIAPAVATLSAGLLTITYTKTGSATESVTLNNDGTNIVAFDGVSLTFVAPVAAVSKIVISDAGGSNNQFLNVSGASAFSLSGGFSIADVENATI